MNPIHIVIREERRKAPRALATVINNDLHTPDGLDKNGMPKFITTPQSPQLHTLGKRAWRVTNEKDGTFKDFEHEDDASDYKDALELDNGTDTATVAEAPLNVTNIAYAAEWDQKSPWINVLKSNELPDDIKMTYMGWPTVTKEQYEKDNPPTNPDIV